jgi:hypothetical protein
VAPTGISVEDEGDGNLIISASTQEALINTDSITITRDQNADLNISGDSTEVEATITINCSDWFEYLETIRTRTLTIGASKQIHFVYALPLDDNNDSWSDTCDYADLTIEGIPDFCE